MDMESWRRVALSTEHGVLPPLPETNTTTPILTPGTGYSKGPQNPAYKIGPGLELGGMTLDGFVLVPINSCYCDSWYAAKGKTETPGTRKNVRHGPSPAPRG